jgi:hypothetical protein
LRTTQFPRQIPNDTFNDRCFIKTILVVHTSNKLQKLELVNGMTLNIGIVKSIAFAPQQKEKGENNKLTIF